MTDSPDPPRVRISLPGGQQTTGRIMRWRQGPDGRWWAEVAMYVLAGAVSRVDGEEYESIPREGGQRAETPEYVLENAAGGGKILTLHRADCPAIPDKVGVRHTPLTAMDARPMLKMRDTVECGMCRPEP